jgi:hypothetical protein
MTSRAAGVLIPFLALSCSGVALAAPPRQVARFDAMPKPAILSDGTLAAYFLDHEGPGLAPTPEVQQMFERTSSDEGTSWTPRRPLFTLPREEGGFGYFVLLMDRKGELHFFLLNDARSGVIRPRPRSDPHGPVEPLPSQRLDIWHVRSTGGRKQWSAPRRIWQGRAGDLLSVIETRAGRLVLPVSYFVNRSWANRGTGPDRFTFTGQFDTTALYSDDGGDNWKTSASVLRTPTPDLSSYGAVEPAVIELKDGRIWMLLRTQLGRFFESFSANGADWSPARPTAIRSSDSPAALLRLPDGRILLMMNQCARHPYAQGARNVLHAAVSTDEGRSWQHTREILRDPQRNEPPPTNGDYGLSYPFAVCNRQGIIFYSLWVQTGRGRTLERLDTAWLAETRQHDGFSGGLDTWSIFGTRGVVIVDDRRAADGRALAIARTSDRWPAAAVRNFPQGFRGRLQMRLMAEPGFGELSAELADHFSVPADPESHLFAVFQLTIRLEGTESGSEATAQSSDGVSLRSGQWHLLELDWDCTRRSCAIRLNGKPAARLTQLHESPGPCYLRLRATAEKPSSARMLIDSVDVEVSANR